jgi:hypothetical protein
VVTSLLHRVVEGPVADTGHPPFLSPVVVGWGRVVTCGATAAGREGAGARPGRGPGAARRQPCGAALWSCVCTGLLPRAGAQLPVDCVSLLGGWLVLVRVCVDLQSGAALIDVRLDVGPLPPSSSPQTVAGCQLGGFPART